MNFAKFLRTPFFTEDLRWLLLHRDNFVSFASFCVFLLIIFSLILVISTTHRCRYYSGCKNKLLIKIPLNSNLPHAILVSMQLHVTTWLKWSKRHKKSNIERLLERYGWYQLMEPALSFVFC